MFHMLLMIVLALAAMANMPERRIDLDALNERLGTGELVRKEADWYHLRAAEDEPGDPGNPPGG